MILSIRLQETPLLVGIVLAFIGGLLSFASPCCLPLIPGYLGHLAGVAVSPERASRRRGVLLHAMAFVLGFSTVFTIIGIAIGQVLRNVQVAQGYVRWIGGLVIILMGLHATGLVEIPFLHRTISMHPLLPRLVPERHRLGIVAGPSSPQQRERSLGTVVFHPLRGVALPVLRSSLVGVFFAAGWSPCIDPILTGIYGVVGSQPANGGILFFTYSLGLGVPFLVIGLLFQRLRGGLWHLNRYYNVVSLVSGLFLILIGILLFTDTFSRLARFAPVINLPGVS